MDIVGHFGEVNWLAVIAATVFAFMLGGAWYSKAMFGTMWMQEIGLTEETIEKSNMVRTFVAIIVLQLIAATALAVFLGNDSSWLIGLHDGATIGLVWIASSYAITYLFEQRSMRIFLINAGFYVVLFSAMGAILGAWH